VINLAFFLPTQYLPLASSRSFPPSLFVNTFIHLRQTPIYSFSLQVPFEVYQLPIELFERPIPYQLNKLDNRH
jgi:hypothetical protein